MTMEDPATPDGPMPPGDPVTLDDRLAELADIDPDTRLAVRTLLDGMTDADSRHAATIRDALLAELGSFSASWPDEVPPGSAAAWVSAVLGAVPTVADWMRAAGIPDPTIAATLGDVGRHLRLGHRNTRRTGFDAPVWMLAVLSGSLYQLGRLQFDLRRRRQAESVLPAGYGEWVLDVHIPEAGPLTPDAVDASLRRAVTFFGRHFPDRPVRAAVCASWLLDPYLGRHLDPSSNMVSFQQLFTAFGEPRDDQLDAVYFTFGQRSLDRLDRLPRRSSLQRLVLERLASGQRWQVVHGYRELP
jgi:hypothetical protein